MNSDFGKHIIPFCLEQGHHTVAYEFEGFWKDVGTLESYWQANMELISLVPDFNLYEAYWKIYTKSDIQPPQYIAGKAVVDICILGEGTEIYGEIYNSVIGSNVTVGVGSKVYDSIIMSGTTIKDNVTIIRGVVSEKAVIGNNVTIGEGPDTPNEDYPKIYNSGISVIGENTVIPDNVWIGKNCALDGMINYEHFEEGRLESGKNIIIEEVGE